MAASDDTAGVGRIAGSAQAGEVFTWNPQAAGLSGEAFTADTIHFADYDSLVLAPDSGTFAEAGYLPVTGFSLAGQPVEPVGLNDPGGAGWGAYLRIEGTGTLSLPPPDLPGVAYPQFGYEPGQLVYEIVGFNGLATYGFDEGGNVVVGGTINDPVTLAAGSLTSANVTFVPTSSADPTIAGTVSLTVDELAPGFAAGRLDVFNVSFVHPPEDYGFTSPTTIRVDAESGTTGTFAAAAVEDSTVPGEAVDWDAIAAQGTANFEATGQWYV